MGSLYLNNVKKMNITGHFLKWQLRQVQVSPGKNTLRWLYQKDSGNSRGADRAWVANIRLVRGKCLVPVIRPGHRCDIYKKHQWCTASGHYGKNWNTWQFYKVNDKTALTCPQCGCKSKCDPNWKDAHGLSCSEYQKLKICTPQGGYGPGWANLTFADFTDCHGRTAKVCPQCGCKEPRRYDWSSALKFKGRWTASGWEIARDKRNPRILVARTMNIIGNYGRAYLTVSFVVSRISCIKYSWRLHSEENYDFLSLYVNGVKKINITGHLQHWQSRQVQVSSGEKTLSWVYQKDSGYSSGTDRAWVVNIRLVRGKCLVPAIRPGKCDSSWKDQDGYGCDTYKKHQWCTASGQYGKNWNTWQFYKMNGKTALTCPQCGCKSNCDPNWKDAHGLSCSEYQKLKICTPQGRYGPGWANLTFADFSDCYGRTAKVCPQCGCKSG